MNLITCARALRSSCAETPPMSCGRFSVSHASLVQQVAQDHVAPFATPSGACRVVPPCSLLLVLENQSIPFITASASLMSLYPPLASFPTCRRKLGNAALGIATHRIVAFLKHGRLRRCLGLPGLLGRCPLAAARGHTGVHGHQACSMLLRLARWRPTCSDERIAKVG